MESIVFDVQKVWMATLHKDDKISPCVLIHVEPLSEEVEEQIIVAGDLGERTIPGYYILDAETDAENDSARVLARLGTEVFEDVDEDDGGVYAQTVEVDVPLHFLLLSRTLSLSPTSLRLILTYLPWEEGRSTDEYLENAVLDLVFPPEGSEAQIVVDQIFEEIAGEGYKSVLPKEAYSANGDAVPVKARAAQSFLLSLYDGLASGSEASLTTLLSLHEKMQEKMSGTDSVKEDEPFLHYVMILATEAYRRSWIDVDGARPGDINLTHPSDADLDAETQSKLAQDFVEIINSNELVDILDEVDDVRVKESNPFEQGFPEQMATLEEFFAEGRPAHVLKNLILPNGVTSQHPNNVIEEHGIGSYVAAIILISAARAARLLSDGPSPERNDHKVAYIASRWLTLEGDEVSWELSALYPFLTEYDIKLFSHFLEYANEDEDDEIVLPFLQGTLHQLGIALVEENWTAENLEVRLSMMDISLPEMSKVKKFLKAAVSTLNLGRNESGKACPGCQTLSLVEDKCNTLDDFRKIIPAVALTIPVLADINAAEGMLDVGSEEWRQFRMRYVADFLLSASSQL